MAEAKKKAKAAVATDPTLAATCNRSDLMRAVATLRQISGAKTYPITANVLIRSNESGGLAVEATNLKVFGVVSIPGEVTADGAITVDAKRLGDFVRELPEGDLTIAGMPNGFVEVRSGRSRAKLAGMPAADFPATPASDGKECRFVIDGDSLADMIDRSLFAVAPDDLRPTLNGLNFELKPTTFGIAGTDGHRLSHEEADVECSGERQAIVPASALRVVRRALVSENVTVSVSDSVAWFGSADWMIGARLIDGDYPDYSQVVPKNTTTVLDVPRGELLSCVRRVSVVTSDRAKGIRFRVADGVLELLAQSADYGEATESVACEVVSGTTAEVGFNANYFLQALEALDGVERVQIGLGSDHSPAAITAPDVDGWLHVVMPMRM
jgi:DNA polymerase-3 subunit beta